MEKKLQSLMIFDIQARFSDDGAGLSNLSELKWAGITTCPKCGNNKYIAGETVSSAGNVPNATIFVHRQVAPYSIM